MPADLTIFAAKYLVFIAAVLAAAVLAVRLWQQPRLSIIYWLVAAGIVLALSFALALLGGALYKDPRPFTTSHVAPLIPHAADNGFPSDHALLAAALVALVALVDLLWTLPFILLAVLIDWARVGAGIHHLIDVVGSSVLVVIATVIAVAVARLLTDMLASHLPPDWDWRRLTGRDLGA